MKFEKHDTPVFCVGKAQNLCYDRGAEGIDVISENEVEKSLKHRYSLTIDADMIDNEHRKEYLKVQEIVYHLCKHVLDAFPDLYNPLSFKSFFTAYEEDPEKIYDNRGQFGKTNLMRIAQLFNRSEIKSRIEAYNAEHSEHLTVWGLSSVFVQYMIDRCPDTFIPEESPAVSIVEGVWDALKSNATYDSKYTFHISPYFSDLMYLGTTPQIEGEGCCFRPEGEYRTAPINVGRDTNSVSYWLVSDSEGIISRGWGLYYPDEGLIRTNTYGDIVFKRILNFGHTKFAETLGLTQKHKGDLISDDCDDTKIYTNGSTVSRMHPDWEYYEKYSIDPSDIEYPEEPDYCEGCDNYVYSADHPTVHGYPVCQDCVDSGFYVFVDEFDEYGHEDSVVYSENLCEFVYERDTKYIYIETEDDYFTENEVVYDEETDEYYTEEGYQDLVDERNHIEPERA